MDPNKVIDGKAFAALTQRIGMPLLNLPPRAILNLDLL